MKRFVPFVFSLFALIACEKEESVPEPQYQLVDIVYSLEDGDGLQEETEDLATRVIRNDTGSELTYTPVCEIDKKDESTFKSDDPNAFLITGTDSVSVLTPTLIVDGEIYTMKTNIYSDELQYTKPSVSTLSITTVPVNTKLTVEQQLIWKFLTVTYKVTFKDKLTGNQKSAKGKWTGKVCGGDIGHYTLDELK